MKIRTPLFVAALASVAFAGASLSIFGSTFSPWVQIEVGPPAPTTIAAVPTLQGYGVALRWEAPESPDITGFRIERYSWDADSRTWSPATTITVANPTARTYVDMAGMGRWAYRVQSITERP